ncbi:uncharacterized protein LOC135369276 [Ornithodoros turicata]|uniref:uncharacterized protein LOC135369276 n=1 Tax=Ornithodoros turicata TaxID=34597 RepID=UPI003138EBEB
MVDVFVPVQGTGATLLEQVSTEEEKSNQVLLAIILFFAIVTAAGFVFWAFLWNKELPTTKKQDDASPARKVTVPEVSLNNPSPSYTDYEDYSDNTDATVATSPVQKQVCESHDCRYVRQFIEAVVDTDRDPCDTSFKFVCRKNEQLPPNMYIDKFD